MQKKQVEEKLPMGNAPHANEKPTLQYTAYATFNPEAVLSGGFELEEKIIDDLGRFEKQSLDKPRSRLPRPSTRVVGIDTEYDPSSRLLTLGVATARDAIAYEVQDTEGIKKAKRLIREAQTVVGHSVPGDLDYLVRLGVAKDRWLRGLDIRDSLLLARMADENRGKGAYGLESLLLSEVNFTEWKAETAKLLKENGDASTWTPEQRTERCRLDAWATYILAEHFEKKL
jgi:hypothetical protein